MEKILGMLESEFSRVLRLVIANQRLPEGEDFNWFLNFVGVGRSIDRNTKAQFRKLFSTREGWNRFREDLARTGSHVPDEQYEKFRRLAESENFEVNLDQTSHVRTMAMELMDEMLAALVSRYWSLGVAAPGAPDFVMI